MNTNFYKLTERLREVCKDNTLVQTVIYARTEEKDLYKNTKYPLIHLNPAPSNWSNEKVNSFTFEIGVFDQRTTSKQTKDTVFEGNDNIIDNHNTCYAILNEILTVLSKDNSDIIYMTSVGPITPFYKDDGNGLDGWATTITFDLPNFLNVC